MRSLKMLKLGYSVQRTCTVSIATASSACKCSVIWHADVFVMRKCVTAKHAIADYAMHVSEYVCYLHRLVTVVLPFTNTYSHKRWLPCKFEAVHGLNEACLCVCMDHYQSYITCVSLAHV